VETTAAEVTEHPDIARIAAAAHAEPGAV
jgi:hypothetical protein